MPAGIAHFRIKMIATAIVIKFQIRHDTAFHRTGGNTRRLFITDELATVLLIIIAVVIGMGGRNSEDKGGDKSGAHYG